LVSNGKTELPFDIYTLCPSPTEGWHFECRYEEGGFLLTRHFGGEKIIFYIYCCGVSMPRGAFFNHYAQMIESLLI